MIQLCRLGGCGVLFAAGGCGRHWQAQADVGLGGGGGRAAGGWWRAAWGYHPAWPTWTAALAGIPRLSCAMRCANVVIIRGNQWEWMRSSSSSSSSSSHGTHRIASVIVESTLTPQQQTTNNNNPTTRDSRESRVASRDLAHHSRQQTNRRRQERRSSSLSTLHPTPQS